MASFKPIIFENRVKKSGETAVYILIQLNKKTFRINTGVSVLPAKWDKTKTRIKGNSKAAKDNNLIIQSCLARINEIFVRYRLQNKLLTPDLLLREYKNPSIYVDFYYFLEEKIKERVKTKEISPVSGVHQKVLLHKLKDFKKKLAFAEIDLKLINQFKLHCRKTGNSVNTIEKVLTYWKTYLNIAVREEIINKNPFDLYQAKKEPTSRVYLTEQELNNLISIYDKKEFYKTLHKTLRHFLFMCLTGVRISDLKRLKHDHNLKTGLLFIPHKTRGRKSNRVPPLIQKRR